MKRSLKQETAEEAFLSGGPAPRPLFIEAQNFHAANPQQDETQDKSIRFRRTLSFTLPRGCYATVLLRALGH